MKKRLRKLAGCAALVALLLLTQWSGLLTYAENAIQDRVYQQPGEISPDIVVFGIDEKALAELGRFPSWSRQIMADAINILNSGEEKPAVIAVDVLYAEESHDPVADENFAKAAADGGNVVMASYAYVGRDMSMRKTVLDYERPYAALERSVAAYGFVNAAQDDDNILRNASLTTRFGEETLYSFPYEIWRQYTGEDRLPYENDGAYIAFSGLPGDYYGDSASGSGLSFADIFDEDFDPDYFADCIVLIGAYAVGLGDVYSTPTGSGVEMYGVEVHANVVQMLLEGNFKNRVSMGTSLLILLAILLLGAALSEFLDVRMLLGVFILIGAAYCFAALRLYGAGYLLPLFGPVLSLTLLYAYQLIYGYVAERLEKKRLKATFMKYVDPTLAEQLAKDGGADTEGAGSVKHIAVMFIDVRGFTPMTEALRDSPETLVKILDEYLELTSGAVFRNGGSVDKFIGDATMALFNGFVPLEDYVFKAVKTAWDIVLGAAEVNRSIREKYGVDLGFGIGVNCGEAVVGNIGASFRKDYTAIGDAVNTAARLESNAGRSQVLISRDVYDLVSDRVEAVSVGEIPLKGKSVKIEVFSVEAITG